VGKQQKLTDDPGFGPGCLVLQMMGLIAIVAALSIFVLRPKRMQWMEIPAYPGIAQVISRDEQEKVRRIEFTTTASFTDTLAWYDATFTTGGWENREPYDDAEREYRFIRQSPCTIFHVELKRGQSGHLIETDRLELPRSCQPRNNK
jgi:hypothetical protein